MSDAVEPLDLDAIRERVEAATDAPWTHEPYPAHWERHGHPGEPCPPYGCAARAEPVAPTVEEVAEVLATHRAEPNHAPHCACGWRPALSLNDNVADRHFLRRHQAEQVAALWGAL